MRCKVVDGYLDILEGQQLLDLIVCKIEVQGVGTVEVVVMGIIVLLIRQPSIEGVKSNYAALVAEFSFDATVTKPLDV